MYGGDREGEREGGCDIGREEGSDGAIKVCFPTHNGGKGREGEVEGEREEGREREGPEFPVTISESH